VQNLTPLALSSAEKSVTVQTHKITTKKQTVNDISTPCLSACVDITSVEGNLAKKNHVAVLPPLAEANAFVRRVTGQAHSPVAAGEQWGMRSCIGTLKWAVSPI